MIQNSSPTMSQDGRGQANPYAASERFRRALWSCVYWTVFRGVPRIFNEWHRTLLRMFGGTVGSGVTIYPSALIDCPWNLSLADYCVIGAGVRLYALGKISVGAHSVVSQRVHVCAGSHDYTNPRMPLQRPPIKIGNAVWICTEAFIGPGAIIGDRSVVGARSVVVGPLPSDTVCAGVPCKPIKPRIMRRT